LNFTKYPALGKKLTLRLNSIVDATVLAQSRNMLISKHFTKDRSCKSAKANTTKNAKNMDVREQLPVIHKNKHFKKVSNSTDSDHHSKSKRQSSIFRSKQRNSAFYSIVKLYSAEKIKIMVLSAYRKEI